MRVMKTHIKGRQNVDYYECTECGWAYPAFSGNTTFSAETRPTKEKGLDEFNKHDCDSFPRSQGAAN
jgi:hypothetical protein